MKLSFLIETLNKNQQSDDDISIIFTESFLNAVQQIVQAVEDHKNDTIQEEIKNKDISFDTTLKFIHKSGFDKGKISPLHFKLGLSDKANSYLVGDKVDGLGIKHSLHHAHKFAEIIKHIPQEDINKIKQMEKTNNPLETILLSIPFVIEQFQYKRLSNRADKYSEAKFKTAIIYANSIFVISSDFQNNTVFILTFYPIDKKTKKETIDKNNAFQKQFMQDILHKNKGS